MTGSLQTKNGYYYAVMNVKDYRGKRKQKWIPTFLPVQGNKRKAQAKLDELKVTYATLYEKKQNEQSPLFVDCIRDWLKIKKEVLDPSTYEGYELYSEKHIIPYFEKLDLKVSEVTPKHIEQYYSYKFTSGRCDKKSGGLSISSLKKHAVILKQVLNHAVITELIQRSPAEHIPLPRRNEAEPEREFLDVNNAQSLISAFSDHPLQYLVYVTLNYGLRRSEVLGLKWNAIDFENNTLRIQHTVVENISIIEKDKTKTQSSRRTYPLQSDMKNILLTIKRQKESYKKQFGAQYINNDYVFTWPNGKPYRPDYITKAFQKVLQEKGFKKMRFHDLRHSTASIMFNKGLAMKDIQCWLGHSNMQTTSDIYTHLTEAHRTKIAEAMAKTFSI